MRKFYSFLFVTVFFISTGKAQDTTMPAKEIEKFNVMLALQVGVPFGDMEAAVRNNMGNLGFGGGFCFLTNPFTWGSNKRNSPLRIGAEIGYTYYGRFISNTNISGYNGSYKTSYGILQANALLRVCNPEPETPVRPFLEIFAGGNFYLSSTKDNLNAIETALGIDGFEIDNYASAGFNKGLAVGCSFGKKKKADAARFILRLSYNIGSDIKYVIRNSLTYDPSTGGLQYQVGSARVSYLMIQIGVGL